MKNKLYTVSFYVTAQVVLCDDGDDDAVLPTELKDYEVLSISDPELIDVETVYAHDF
jgi:hypothetical protein